MVSNFYRPFKYRVPRVQRVDVPASPRTPAEEEGLTGFVLGKEASDLEERFARALNTYNIDFAFQISVETAVTLPQQEKEVDFMVYAGQPQPLEVDGNFTHKSAEQKEYDRERDAQIDATLRPFGYLPVGRVTEEHLGNQDGANMFVAEFIA